MTVEAEEAPPGESHTGSPKRRQVVDAAFQLFITHGYGAVSMDAVARAAGVSKATLYAYFTSKERLFTTIVTERGLSASLDDSLLPEHVSDLRTVMERIGQGVMRFMLREQTLAIYRMALAECARFPELGRAFHAAGPRMFCDRVTAWMALQQAAGVIRDADVSVAAQQFMALLRSGLFLRASLVVPPEPTDAEIKATVAAAVDTWLRAYATHPPQA